MTKNPIDPNDPWDEVDLDKVSDLVVALIEKKLGVTPGFILIGLHPTDGKIALSTNLENDTLGGLLTQIALQTVTGNFVDSRDVPPEGATKQ